MVDASAVTAAEQVLVEAAQVEPEAARVPDQVGLGQAAAGRVQRVVHLPEPALRGSRLRRLGRLTRVRVDRLEREVPEHEPQPVAQARAHAFEDRLGRGAVRALEVAVHHELEIGAGRPAHVIAGSDWLGEAVGHSR